MKLLMENWKRFLTEKHTYTAKEAQDEASAHEGNNEPYDVKVEDLIWRYEPEYNLNNLIKVMPSGTLEGWKKWLQKESEYRAELGDENWLNRFTKWWLSDPTKEPIVVIEDQQGRAEGIWDGWHRTAVSITSGLRRIPAFVGKRI